MEKTRVPKGEQYWSIYIIASSGPQVYQTEEKNSDGDNDNFKCGNYFRTKVEADAMTKKLIAVLKGAEVIEMPSESEIEKEALENNYIHKERGDCNYPDDLCVEIFKDGINYLKSKIVK